MFELGLSYIKADFHLHTHKDKEFKYSGEQNSFVKDYVAGLKRADISLGIITNHNKFDKEEYSAICKKARKEDIFILPGVELTVKEGSNGVHTLIVFNPDEWLSNGDNHIDTFITSAFATISNPKNRNTKCIYDLRKTIEALDAYDRDYFIVFAHVDQKSGLFVECDGGLLETLSGIASFKKRVLGLQKMTSQKNKEQFKRIFGYLPALVEGSDPKSIDDIGKGNRHSYLKIGEYSYSAVKFALQDNGNRLFFSIPDNRHGYIKSLTFLGGKFDKQVINFSPELNALIGIRGSGKSAVLEIVRYILGFNPQTDEVYKESLVKNILGPGGKTSLLVVDKHKKRYIISRILGEQSCVVDEDGNELKITPISLFDGVQYFGQKDLSNSVDHENELLEKLVSGKIVQSVTIDEYVKELSDAVGQLLAVKEIPRQIETENIHMAEITHKLSIFEEKGVAEKLKKQAAYTKDRTIIDSVKTKVEDIIKVMEKDYATNKEASSSLSEYKSIYNGALVTEAQKILKLIDQQLSIIGNSIQQMKIHKKSLVGVAEELDEQIKALADEFAEIKREIKDDKLDADMFVKLTESKEKVKIRLQQLKEGAIKKEAIKKAYKDAKLDRYNLLFKSFHNYQTEIKRINEVQDELCIEIDFRGDKDKFKERMKADFTGTGINGTKYQKICDNFKDYVDLVEDWILEDGKKLREILTFTEYSKLDNKLQNNYSELLTYQVQNKVEIYYHNKLLKQHSIGQRASALILFILMQDNNDVIFIDQPEDDLDNKVIYNEVISTIVKKKPFIQFIFATHNANIPVLGDAERIFVFDYQDTKIDVSQGNIDLRNTQKQIVDIMEGGQEAFEKRQLIYKSWK